MFSALLNILMVSTHGCSGVLQDISRLYLMKTLVWGGRVSPLTIWCAGRPGRKHRECSLRPWYANSSRSFAVQCRASLMTTNLYSVSSTGADDKGLHQRGSTKPLRLCEHKARSKAADVRILDHHTQLTLARYIPYVLPLYPALLPLHQIHFCCYKLSSPL
jgi:hypothetical protein